MFLLDLIDRIPAPRAAQADASGAFLIPQKRWRCDLRPDAGTLGVVRADAEKYFKGLLGVDKLPDGHVIEEY